jgi:predicted transcriptional regulator
MCTGCEEPGIAARFKTAMFNPKQPTPLEQFIMDYLWAHPDCTAGMCREGIAPRVLKDSTIRTILRNLEEKG